jgi:hypothetical protein
LATPKNPTHAEKVEKLLRRANQGNYVTEKQLEPIARALCINPQELVFSHPAIYARKARKHRQEHQHRKVTQRRLDELAAYPVHVERLAVDRPELMARVVQLLEQDRDRLATGSRAGDRSLQFRSMLAGAGGQQAKEQAVATFTSRVFADPGAIGESLPVLNAAGVNAWFGEYEERVPIGPEATEFNLPYTVAAGTERKGVVAFQGITQSAPIVTVDLSHTAALGPTLEDLYTRNSDG